MKKTLLFLAVAGLMVSGCSKTWSGIKQDSSELLDDTRDVIHEATAPTVDSSTRIVQHNNVASDAASQIVMEAPQNNAGANTNVVTPTTSQVQVFTDEPTVVSAK